MQHSLIRPLSISLFVALLLWGLYSLLYYLGVPVHFSVLLSPEAQQTVRESCTSMVCSGAYTLFPYIENTLKRIPFLGWYTLVCVILYGLYVVKSYLQTTNATLQFRARAWHFVAGFLAIMWILFTCISYMQSGDATIRRFVEPLPNVYRTAGAETLQTLQDNYERLLGAGCLNPVGEFGGSGATEYRYSTVCVQQSFFTRVMPQFMVVLLFLFEILVLGHAAFRLFRLRAHRVLVEGAVSMGLGVGTLIAAIWTLAVLGIYSQIAGWLLVIVIPIISYRSVLYWFHRFFSDSWLVEEKWYSPRMLLLWLLMSYLALNFINVVRPFPIGWDDLGSYLNRPRQLVSYGEFLFSMAPFQWEYITSLGFRLFGFSSTFGANASMIINWSQGLLAVLMVYIFGNVFIGRGRGILSAALYYFLPLVGHFSYADMKIDNSLFAMGALAMFILFLFLFGPQDDQKDEADYSSLTWMLLVGLFAGLAFGMKVTAIMVLMAIGAVLLGAMLHPAAFAGSFVLAFVVFAKQGAFDVGTVIERLGYGEAALSQNVFMIVAAVIGLMLIVFAALRGRADFKRTAQATGMLVAGFFIAIYPWVQHNNLVRGQIIPRLELGAPNTITPSFDAYGGDHKPEENVRVLPAHLAVSQNHPACSATGAEEELGRYWGNRVGWGHYLTLPWRTMNNIDSAGYYVTTMPSFALFPLLLLLPFFWMTGGRWLRWMWVATFFLIVQWSFLANGVPWYGIGMFLGLVLCLEALIAKAPDNPNRWLAAFLVTAGILVCFGNRFWQFEQQINLFEYPLGKVSYEALRERTIPHYDDITDIVLQRHDALPNRPYLYRIGTFMPYFVPRNLEVIGVSDHQLDFFNCLYQDRDPALMVQRLKALGFNSIVFDTNTATIERDPNGSLHQKVNTLAEFLNSPEAGLQLVINDPNGGIAFIIIP